MWLEEFRNKSREPWLYSPPQLSPLDHGEKSSLLANLLHSSPDMPKLDLLDLETFINLPTSCENPLEIHPLTEIDALLSQKITNLPSLASRDLTNVMRKSQPESSGVFYQPKLPKLKLEMELFSDLSSFCQPMKSEAAVKAFQNAVDELNTPVFEKAPFNYDRPPTSSSELLDVVTSTEDPFNFKIKSELPSIDNNVNIENNLMNKEEHTIAFMEGERKDITSTSSDINTSMGGTVDNYIVISSHGISTNSSNVFNPNHSEYENIYRNTSDKVTPIYNKLIGEDEEYLPTVNNCSDIFIDNNTYVFDPVNESSNSQVDDSLNHQYILLQTAPFDTPDDSRSASEFSENAVSPPLTLKIDNIFKNTNAIDTPEVIDAIDAIETEKGFIIGANKEFNILNFINEEDVSTVDVSAFSAPIVSAPESPVLNKRSITPPPKQTLKRRRRKDEDDDEDYEPPMPAKKRVAGRKTLKVPAKPAEYESDSDDDDDDDEEQIVIKPARRGRPPKRNGSISSEYSEGTGKYREMRDKNNEASRKSRLKRKLKELSQKEEATGLEERNIKLKAQVAELERTVNNFRDNLMKILLHK